MASKLNWGILATGNIAKAFAKGLAASQTGTLLAVGSRSQAGADKFGAEFNVPRRYGSYEALLADKDVQAIYVATPHPMHAEWAIRCAEAGKHILCEKPMTINHAEAMVVLEACRRHDVFFMEAFMYRCHPQTAKLVELLREKAIGEIRLIHATFSFHAGFNPSSRLFANELGGGGILDVGCYCTTAANLIAGIATGKDFAEPLELKAVGFLGQTGADEYTVAVAKYPGNIVAQLATGISVNQENVIRIYGSEGSIVVPSPWIPARDGGTTEIIINKNGEKEPRKIVLDTAAKLYAIEADTVAANIARRQAPSPAMSWEDSLANMRTMDKWRDQIGLVYKMETAEAQTLPVSKRPLVVGRASVPAGGEAGRDARPTMSYGKIPGVSKPVSRLVMGVDNQRTIAHASAMFDDFIERGGTCFDTAFVYGGGLHEKLLGQWVRNRNIREKVVILDKGAHTPQCNPVALTQQFKISLDRLQMDYVDIYMMHRDNLDVPVGEFIDVLNEHVRAGRMRAFGGSNWSIERVEEANAYAKLKGLQGFAAISNNFSLARMVDPVWDGCIHASDPSSREWLTKTQLPLMPWSSQARGFFTPRADPNDKSDAELVRCWYADDNFKRRERAIELARKRGVLPINIALAYVLCQPFPTFPLIGPRTIEETRSSFASLDVKLTPDELKWLNLE
ncbi:MAG TPA: aldo/keto reductase [Planctomycetota bacterium]|jgi:predicted dehydrogenase/aryl-alcohol dehydrogenase-like predicted oxidoreductase